MVFGDDDEDSSEEVEYKYIPPDEVLPSDAAAPCVAHLLKKKAEKNTDPNVERKRKRKDDESQHNQIAGNAW
jgi:hypothetical protein